MSSKYFISAFLLGSLIAAFASAESPIQPGDRIAIIGNTFADQLRTHGYLETLLLQHTSDQPVAIRNLGWGGDMLAARDRPTGFPSEESTLAAHKTDVIIACFGMGESFAGEEGLDDFQGQLRALIASHAGKQYNGTSEVRLVLVSPIACEDLGELTPQRDKRNKLLAAYTRAMQDVAANAQVPFIDLFEPSRDLMNDSTGPNLTNNGIHLNRYGYWAISHTFYDQLTAGTAEPKRAPWTLRIDAGRASGDGLGVAISELKVDELGGSFRVAEQSAPTLGPPTEEPLPARLASVRDTLMIENLQPGEYWLTIDEKPVATATAQAWAHGVAIDSSPAHKSSEAYRATVNDKNLQFTYSWKALNQVHIVGERRGSPSGKELPKEVLEFNRLANELDKKLSAPIELKTRRWRVTRISQ